MLPSRHSPSLWGILCVWLVFIAPAIICWLLYRITKKGPPKV